VSGPTAARRHQILAAAGPDPAAFLRPEPGRLRFSLGTSLADVAIPMELAADAGAIVRGAAAEVALLLATQHRRYLPADELDRLVMREDYAGLPVPRPILGAGQGGTDLRAATLLAAGAHPALPGGLAQAWLGRGGRGRSLVGLWIELTRRALEEQQASRGREDTPLLVAGALAVATLAAEAEVREVIRAGPAERWLRGAAMTALWVAGRTGLGRALRDAGRPPDDPLLLRCEAVLSPTLLLGGRQGLVAGGATVYGVELSAGVPRAEELAARLVAAADPGAARADLLALLGADEELARRAEQAAGVARLRQLVVQAVQQAEGQGHEARVAPLRELLCVPGSLASAAADAAPRQALARQLSAASPPGEAGASMERAVRALREWRQKEPGAAFGLPREAARGEYADAALALLCDLALDRLSAPLRQALSFRTGREAEGGSQAEYEAGRLYRLSARPGRILNAAVERPTAHLFADVKDFTRRTALLGQAPMAEFLRREFYLPLLTAAKTHYSGMQHLADRGGVTLNNLLGDAVSFSGGIQAMVRLARDVRRAFAAYGARLSAEVSGAVVSRQLEAIEARHAEAAVQAGAARAEAEAAAARAAPGSAAQGALLARAARLAAEEALRNDEKEQAVLRARGEGLEAGVFISWGAPPLVVVIEDDVFGTNRVAIADKINESARGTARAPSARQRADAQLAAERLARRSPQLAHAWGVFIGSPLKLPVAPEVEDQALRAARAADLQGAMRLLAAPVREGVEAALREPAERPGDIYNSGAALSEEALLAFLEEVGEQRVVRRVELDPAAVPGELRDFFFFGAEPQSLVVCFHPDGRPSELFRRVGRAGFKGLGGVTVWELCAEQGGPAALLKRLGPAWFEAASGPA
jgi:hypothetical protein